MAASLVLVAGACSSDDTSTTVAGEVAGECDQGPTVDPVRSEPVPDVEGDVTITSFDGASIRVHWYPVVGAPEATPAPTVLAGPGWGQAGETTAPTDAPDVGTYSIRRLRSAGYNVLTWDPRGFGGSTGEAHFNDPEFEGRDAQVLLDWIAQQPEAQLDREGDPRVGMVGSSLGGGIQFLLAARDCRVDVIVPTDAWHSLVTSLVPNDTAKSGWIGLLALAEGRIDTRFVLATQEVEQTGVASPASIEWLASIGPGDRVEEIAAPTLIVQSTVDGLFPLGEGVANFEALRRAGAPVAMLWVCGGHGLCLTGDESGLRDQRSLAWLDRYLKDDATAELGPVVDIVDQHGRRWTGADYPSEPDERLVATGSGGVLELTADSVAGPLGPLPGADAGTNVIAGITPSRANDAVELTFTATDDALVVGAPSLTVAYRGTTPDGSRPTRAFAQLVDDETGLVVGNQISPIPLTLDGDEHGVEVDLEVIAHHLAAGQSLTLQIVATTPAFATPRLGGTLSIARLQLELPATSSLALSEPS